MFNNNKRDKMTDSKEKTKKVLEGMGFEFPPKMKDAPKDCHCIHCDDNKKPKKTEEEKAHYHHWKANHAIGTVYKERDKMKKENKVTLDNADFIWFWENDHRKSNTVYVGLNENTFRFDKNHLRGLMSEIKVKGARFYTCDDDYKDGDDYRYGYFYPAKEINHDPVDQMEGDGHIHMFVREEGKYKAL
jgi:hypothetical protein|tara:strand:+ start:48 stop:611 length:564 start_codon:yes stop_codon:yes gene_type:complete